jgi:hypothetical protein
VAERILASGLQSGLPHIKILRTAEAISASKTLRVLEAQTIWPPWGAWVIGAPQGMG